MCVSIVSFMGRIFNQCFLCVCFKSKSVRQIGSVWADQQEIACIPCNATKTICKKDLAIRQKNASNTSFLLYRSLCMEGAPVRGVKYFNDDKGHKHQIYSLFLHSRWCLAIQSKAQSVFCQVTLVSNPLTTQMLHWSRYLPKFLHVAWVDFEIVFCIHTHCHEDQQLFDWTTVTLAQVGTESRPGDH